MLGIFWPRVLADPGCLRKIGFDADTYYRMNLVGVYK
jgi:hypothetical protein